MEEVRGKMGSKKWTVVYESEEGAAIESLRHTVDSMKAEYDKKFKVVEDITVVPFVQNVAVQILLFLVGAQPGRFFVISYNSLRLLLVLEKRLLLLDL